MKAPKAAKGARTERTLMRWVDQQLAGDRDLARRVEALLDQMRVEQDLVALRQARGLSQSQLAKILHISQPRIAKIESGEAKNLELKTLVRYAAALGARVSIAIETGWRQARGAAHPRGRGHGRRAAEGQRPSKVGSLSRKRSARPSSSATRPGSARAPAR
jgi:transcriptional regulator with XRE-family HTH domain